MRTLKAQQPTGQKANRGRFAFRSCNKNMATNYLMSLETNEAIKTIQV